MSRGMWLLAGARWPTSAVSSCSCSSASLAVGGSSGGFAIASLSAGTMTHDVIGSPSSSEPSSTRSSRLPMGALASPSFMCSTVTVMLPCSSRATAICTSSAPARLVCPRGRPPAMPQWWMMITTQPKVARTMSAALMNLAISSDLFSSPSSARLSVSITTATGISPPSCSWMEAISAPRSAIRSTGTSSR